MIAVEQVLLTLDVDKDSEDTARRVGSAIRLIHPDIHVGLLMIKLYMARPEGGSKEWEQQVRRIVSGLNCSEILTEAAKTLFASPGWQDELRAELAKGERA